MEKKLTVLLLLIVENRILNNSTGDILSVYEQLKKRIVVYVKLTCKIYFNPPVRFTGGY